MRSRIEHFKDNKSIIEDIEINDVFAGAKGKKIRDELMKSYTDKTAAVPSNGSSPTVSLEDFLGLVNELMP